MTYSNPGINVVLESLGKLGPVDQMFILGAKKWLIINLRAVTGCMKFVCVFVCVSSISSSTR